MIFLYTRFKNLKTSNKMAFTVFFLVSNLLISLLSQAIIPSYCCAEDSAGTILTVKEALSKANANNPSLKALAKTLHLTDYEVHEAGHLPNPYFYGSVGTGKMVSELGYNNSLGFSQTIELGNKRHKRVDLAKAKRSVSRSLYNLALWKFNGNVQVLYDEYATAIDLRNMIKTHIASLVAFERGTHQLSRLEAIHLTMARDDLQNKLTDAEKAIETAHIAFNALISENSNFSTANYTVAPDYFDGITDPSTQLTLQTEKPEELIEVAKSNRADYSAAKQAVTVQEKLMVLDKRYRIPDIDVGLNYAFVNTLSPLHAPEHQFFHGLFPTFGATLPIYHGMKEEIERDQHLIEQASWTTEDVERQVRTDVLKALNELNTAKKKMAQAQAHSFPSLNTLTQDLIEEYQSKKNNVMDYISTVNVYRTLQQEQLRTHRDYKLALIALEQALGTTIPSQ